MVQIYIHQLQSNLISPQKGRPQYWTYVAGEMFMLCTVTFHENKFPSSRLFHSQNVKDFFMILF